MSFFAKLRRATPPASEDIPRAVMTPAVAAIMADGEMQQEEVTQLSNLCAFSPVFAHIEPKRLADMVRELIAEIMDTGGDTVLREASLKLSPELRETAFCFVVRVVMADGTVEAREKDALSRIADILQLEAGAVADIYRVIAMLQRPAH
ncbi:MAG: tellurite resistance TerB family protein [Pseudomonadota bacterium]